MPRQDGTTFCGICHRLMATRLHRLQGFLPVTPQFHIFNSIWNIIGRWHLFNLHDFHGEFWPEPTCHANKKPQLCTMLNETEHMKLNPCRFSKVKFKTTNFAVFSFIILFLCTLFVYSLQVFLEIESLKAIFNGFHKPQNVFRSLHFFFILQNHRDSVLRNFAKSSVYWSFYSF